MHNDLKESRQFLEDRTLLTRSITTDNEILRSKLEAAEAEIKRLTQLSNDQEVKIRTLEQDMAKMEQEHTQTFDSEMTRITSEYNTKLVSSLYQSLPPFISLVACLSNRPSSRPSGIACKYLVSEWLV